MFCLLISPHASPSRRLLRWSHPLSSSRRASRRRRAHLWPVFAFFKCDVRYSRRWTWDLFSWISSPLLEVSRQLIWNAVPELYLMNEQVEFCQRMHFLYWPFYVNMKNQHFYSWSCCYLGVLSSDLSLCPSECMLYECVTMNSLCIFTWKKKKKKAAQGSQNPSKCLVQLNQYVINPSWVWPACKPKCLKVEGVKSLYQIMAKDHVTVFSYFCSDVFSHYLSSSKICVSVFFNEVTGRSFAPAWIYRTLLKLLDVMQSFRLSLS